MARCTVSHAVEGNALSLCCRPSFIGDVMQAGQEEAEVRVEDAAEQASNLLGVQFTRLIASSGFQLVNVNNVAIELKVLLCLQMLLRYRVHRCLLQPCIHAILSHATALSVGESSGQQAPEHQQSGGATRAALLPPGRQGVA